MAGSVLEFFPIMHYCSYAIFSGLVCLRTSFLWRRYAFVLSVQHAGFGFLISGGVKPNVNRQCFESDLKFAMKKGIFLQF